MSTEEVVAVEAGEEPVKVDSIDVENNEESAQKEGAEEPEAGADKKEVAEVSFMDKIKKVFSCCGGKSKKNEKGDGEAAADEEVAPATEGEAAADGEEKPAEEGAEVAAEGEEKKEE